MNKKRFISYIAVLLFSVISFLSIIKLYVGFHTNDNFINGLDIAFYFLISTTMLFGMKKGGIPLFLSISVAMVISLMLSLTEDFSTNKIITSVAIIIIFLIDINLIYFGNEAFKKLAIKSHFRELYIFVFCIAIYESYGIVIYQAIDNYSLVYDYKDVVFDLLIFIIFLFERSLFFKVNKYLDKNEKR